MAVLPKLMDQNTLPTGFIMPTSRAGWHVDIFAHCGNSLVQGPQILSSHQTLTAMPRTLWELIYPGSFKVFRDFLFSEFWPFSHRAGRCSFSENRKSYLMTMMNVTSLSTVQPPLVFKAKVIFPCWCLVIATQLDGAGNYQRTVCQRCLSNHSLCGGFGPGKTNGIYVFCMAFLCLHFVLVWSPQ